MIDAQLGHRPRRETCGDCDFVLMVRQRTKSFIEKAAALLCPIANSSGILSLRTRRIPPSRGLPPVLPSLHRRHFLQVGASSLLGIGLTDVFAGRAASSAAARHARAKSVILVLLTGGASHHDTLDMKPDAPAEIRGEFSPIATAIPGVQICEHLPLLARRLRQWALLRAFSHNENGHLPATHRLLTGAPMPNQRSSDLDNVLSRRDWPCYAAGLNSVRPRHDGIPNGVTLPHSLIEGPLTWPGQHGGFLGAAHDPLLVTQDPNSANFRMDSMSLPADADWRRVEQRTRLLERVAGPATADAFR